MNNQFDSQKAIDSVTQAGLDATRTLLDAYGEIARTLSAANPWLDMQASACCEIPPPCWMPKHFGNFESQACPCGTAILRVEVTNCQPTQSTVKLLVNNDDNLPVKVTPLSATLGAMERKWFTVAVTIPEDVCKGDVHQLLVWVAGCNEHYARWHVRVADGSSGTCLKAFVDDCPDYVHHWYDHFYCAHPCFARDRKNHR